MVDRLVIPSGRCLFWLHRGSALWHKSLIDEICSVDVSGSSGLRYGLLQNDGIFKCVFFGKRNFVCDRDNPQCFQCVMRRTIFSAIGESNPEYRSYVEDGKCFVELGNIKYRPDIVLRNILLTNQNFLGKFYENYNYKKTESLYSKKIRYGMPVCRFGYFDVVGTEGVEDFNFRYNRFKNLRCGMPLYLAEYRACKKLGIVMKERVDRRKVVYIADLVNNHNLNCSGALNIINDFFSRNGVM